MKTSWKTLLCVCVAVTALAAIPASPAAAKGVAAGAAASGVAVNGSEYRYVAISPGTPGKVTVVSRIEQQGGRVSRWWYLPGSYYVPAVAYDSSGGGLSADGRWLVLQRTPLPPLPPSKTRFAVLDTERSLAYRGPGRLPRSRHLFSFIDLPGDFSFDAISPDGSTIYLIHHLSKFWGPDYTANYEVRALDTASGKLLPHPIVDPKEPDEQMTGLPVTRAMSPDGRWAYTLYDGKEPFVHALDTVGRRAVCVDLPQLEHQRNLFRLKLRLEQSGRKLTVIAHPATAHGSQPLLSIDTRSFAVEEVGLAGSGPDGTPWLAAGLAALAAAALLVLWRRRGRTDMERKPA